MEAGFIRAEIRAVMGGNVMRVSRHGIVPFKNYPNELLNKQPKLANSARSCG